MKTFIANPATIERKWYVVDAEGKTLGRLASEIAKVLRGSLRICRWNERDYIKRDVSKKTGKSCRACC